MSFNVKSYSVTGHDVEEPEFRDTNGALPLGEGDNMVYKILHSFIKERNDRFINIATNAVRRATNHRVSSGSTGEFGDNIGHHIHEDEKRQHVSERVSGPLVSGLAYCISSCSMILLNKIVLSSYGFDAGISLMFYQVATSVIYREQNKLLPLSCEV
ncbi:hypothetical protein MRB53_000483 [Persea americana]|uniref:Uncharacterized protein n=1 Tax=Persea americana TaxID=3435 RepID=A0ACC2MP84_PERAE|nr:hypothetical protein MRB53_000483 [Persea americana]